MSSSPQTADIKLSGTSGATVDTRVKLKYDLSNASSLEYLGQPTTLDGSTSGGGSISRAR